MLRVVIVVFTAITSISDNFFLENDNQVIVLSKKINIFNSENISLFLK